MTTAYNPTDTYHAPPWFQASNTDKAKTFINSVLQTLYDNTFHLKTITTEDIAKLVSLAAKTGLTPAAGDVSLPTYATPYLLGTAMAHHTAIETIDHNEKTQDEKLTNINTHVGGNVYGSAAPNYTNHNYFANGSDHHTAISSLDGTLFSSNSTIASLVSSLATLATNVGYHTANMGVGSDTAGGFVYSYKYNVEDGDSYLEVADKYDELLEGNTRETYRTKYKRFSSWIAGLGNPGSYSALFFNNTDDGIKNTTTCTVNPRRHLAYGEATQVLWIEKNITTARNRAVFYIDGDTSFWNGNTVIKFNTIGSTSDVDMKTVTISDINNGTLLSTVSGSGNILMIKIEFSAAAEIYEIFTSLATV